MDGLRLKQQYCNGISKNYKSFKKIHSKIIQKHLQMRMIKKCLKKDTYIDRRKDTYIIRRSPEERWKTIDNLTLIIVY